jgi:hypothetical protein
MASSSSTVKVGLGQNGLRHHIPIEGPVTLNPRAPNRRALPSVQHFKLKPGPIRGPRHFAAQGVDLAHHLALTNPTDSRVAGHLAYLGFIECNQQCGMAQPGPRQSGLNRGMTRTNDDKVCHREIGFISPVTRHDFSFMDKVIKRKPEREGFEPSV